MVWWSQLDKQKVNFDCQNRGRPHRRYNNAVASSQLEYDCIDHLDEPGSLVRFTSIMATIGVSEDSKSVVDMVMAGMNIARCSLMSASRTNHQHSIRNVREAERICSDKVGCFWPLALAVELKGQSMCTGLLDVSLNQVSIPLDTGDTILLTSDREFSNKCRADLLYIDCPHLSSNLRPGMKIIIGRGDVQLACIKESPPYYLCRVDRKGNLGSLREVCIPDIKLNYCNITSKDAADIAFALDNEVDMLIVPHVRNAETPKLVKQTIKNSEKHALVISKICNKEGLLNVDSIIEVSDGIIISQDNLSLELPTPDLWKAINYTIAKCNQEGRPAFLATSKLSRAAAGAGWSAAAAADATRAVLAGAAGLALEGGELGAGTDAAGVALAGEACRQAEPLPALEREFFAMVENRPAREIHCSAACYGAALIARACCAICILVVSSSSRPARWLARLRPSCPVLTVVGRKSVARRLHLYRAVVPLFYSAPAQEEWRAEVTERIRFAMSWGKARGWLYAGAPLVLVSEHALRSLPGDLVRIVYVPKRSDELPDEGPMS